LTKRLSQSYGTNLAWLETKQINSGTVQPNFNYLLGCMTHTAPSDSCSLVPDINTLLLTYLPGRVLKYSSTR